MPTSEERDRALYEISRMLDTLKRKQPKDRAYGGDPPRHPADDGVIVSGVVLNPRPDRSQ